MKKQLSTTILFFLLYFLLPTIMYSQPSFVIETLQGNKAGTDNSLALDIDGYAHISYYDDGPANNLKYARWNGSNWEIQTVDNNTYAGTWNAIALDSKGFPHIVYRDDRNDDLKYAYWDGSQWNITIIQSSGNVGTHCSIALDDNDTPHISYIDEDRGALKYAKKTSTGWEISTIDVEGSYGFSSSLVNTSIAVDRFRRPHISYASRRTSSLLYAYWDGSRWYTETVQYRDWINTTSIALDYDGNPHIAYGRSGGRKGLRYAYKLNGSWQLRVIDENADIRGNPSIKIDEQGFPHIGYGNGRYLKYAYKDNAGWHTQNVYYGAWNITDRALDLDCMGKPYLSFYDSGGGGYLKFARPSAYGPGPFSLVSPNNGAYTTNTPTFRWQLSSYQGNGLSRYELYIDGNFVKSIAKTRCFAEIDQPLSDGIHTWKVRAVLVDGGEIWSSETWSIRVDSSPPLSFNLANPENQSWTAKRKPVFSWHPSTDPGSGIQKYQLYIDGTLNVDNIDPSNTSAESSYDLTDGDHTWYVVAIDNANNQTRSNQTWVIKVDNTPPSPFQLSSPPNFSWTGDTTPTFSWQSSNDAGIGLSKYALFIDGSVAIDSINKAETSITLSDTNALSEGNHVWQVKAYDKLNNVRESSKWTIKVDTTPPTPFSLLSPADSSAVSFPTPEFTWSASQDFESGFSHYQLWIDGKLSVDNITTTKSAPGSPLSEGIHSWYVLALDAVGNVRQSSQVWTVIWDPTPPESFDLISPSDGDTLFTNKPIFTWSSSEDTISGLKRYELWINGIKNRDVSASDTTTISATSLENGNYNWFVKAVDFAENATASSSVRSFTVFLDTTAPVSAITQPKDGMIIGGKSFLIQGTANDGIGTGVALVEIRIDNSDWVPVVSTSDNFATWEYLWSDFSEGTHTIQSRATDKQGNIETPQPGITVTVSRTKPQITSVNASPDPAKAGEITVTIDIDPVIGEIDYTYNPKVTFTPANDTANYVFQKMNYQNNRWTGKATIVQEMNNGEAIIHIEGIRNTLGNEIDRIDNAGTFIIDTVPPEVTQVLVEPDPAGVGQVAISIVFVDTTSGIDATVDPVVRFKSALDSIVFVSSTGFDVSTSTWTGNADLDSTLGDGRAIISVSAAQDQAGNVLLPVENAGSFLIDVTPPLPFALVSPKDSLWTTDQRPSLEWAPAIDATTGLDHYELYLNNNVNLPFVAPDVTSVQLAAPLSDAAYFWYVIAVDKTGNRRKSSETRLFLIDTTPPVTTIISPTAGDTLDQEVTIRGTATDSIGIGVDSVWVSTDGGRTWYGANKVGEDFSRWEYTWKFTESGVRVLKSRGRDKLGNTEMPGPGIVVQLRNYAPQISSIPDTSVLEDTRFVYRVSAVDPNPMDSLRFSDNTDLFEIDPKSGVIDFIPDNDVVGKHSITVYVTDGQLVDSTRFSLTVVNVNDPPSSFDLLEPANGAVVETLNPTLTWEQAIDVDVGDTVRYELMVSERSDFSDTLIAIITFETNYKIPDGLERNKQYYWYVVAKDKAGVSIESKNRFSFRTSDVATDINDRVSGRIPMYFELSQNYPNPFNPETRIRFGLPKAAHVLIEIYNALGQKVRILVDDNYQAGYYERIWDARNDRGEKVPSGIYLLKMRAGDFVKTRKMLVVE